MYARTTYAVGDPAKIEDSLDRLRNEAPKLLADSHGYRMFGLFADREMGKIAMASWWETEADCRSSDEHLADRRASLLTPFADTITVETWEVGAFVPGEAEAPKGSRFRIGQFDIDASRCDDLARLFQERGIPTMRDLPGFGGAAMLLDRSRGRGCVGTLYTDRSSFDASRARQSESRRIAAERTGLRLQSLEEFDVVLTERKPD